MSLQVEIEKKLNDKVLSVSFDTEGKQGITGILGASGCGKSMTLKCIAGIETPDCGKIVLNGRVLFDSGNCHQSCQQHRCGTLKKVASLHLSFLLLDKLSIGIILPGNMTFFISTGAVSHLFPPLLYTIRGGIMPLPFPTDRWSVP